MTLSLITPLARGGVRIYVLDLMLNVSSLSIRSNIDLWSDQYPRRNTWHRCKRRLIDSWPSEVSSTLFGKCCQRPNLHFRSASPRHSLLGTSRCRSFPYTTGRQIMLLMSKLIGYGWISIRLMRRPCVTHFPLLCLGPPKHDLGGCVQGRFPTSSNFRSNSLLSS